MVRGPNAGRPSAASYRYERPVSEERCTHAPDAHVVYDLKASGYRGQLRCRCGKVTVASSKVRDAYVQAEADSRAMLRVAIDHAEAQRMMRSAPR